MKAYGVNELRRMFLDYFASKDHLVMKSFSLVPHNDNSLLIINSGMAPLKPYFTGQEVPPRRRVTTCQKCVRTGDIENVGKTARHLTFFEMLGNFSFGDYFKREALSYSWEFLTKVIGLDEDRLYPSIYYEDDEAFDIWTKEIGVPASKITRFYRDADGKCDNFWEHGAGPCGPCSEIYYDRGEKYGCGKPTCGVGCDCDRYMEVWNDVFSQYDGDGHGHYADLAQKNIDTGMGLERLAVVVQDVDTVFDIDTMKAIRDRVCQMGHTEYETDERKDVSIRLITDHIRSTTFMISDGIMPGNEGRGYVLRRLIRRAARHGRLLGIEEGFMSDLARVVIDTSKDGYPELYEKQDFILKVLSEEESKFSRTIDQGLTILTDMQSQMKSDGRTVLDGRDAFKLYDTYGFPLDLTEEILADDGCTIDTDGFDEAMKSQKDAARKARKTTNYMGADATVYEELPKGEPTEFVGYETLVCESEVIALTTETEVVSALTDGQAGSVITRKTPFYGTMGGQVGDTGVITVGDAVFEVSDTIHILGGRTAHVGRVVRGMIKEGDAVTLSVRTERRSDICKNHSATHLLQRALREVLGSHVEQAGSYVDAERLRFDFSHFQAMTADEIARVEEIVNKEIAAALPVHTEVMSLEAAKQTGAMALFGEKYGDSVRVVTMGADSDVFSRELCGGTHVPNTASISLFKIVSESGIAAGTRRIEALTGTGVLQYYKQLEQTLNEASAMVKATPDTLTQRLSKLMGELKELSGENESLHSKMAQAALGETASNTRMIRDVKLYTASVPDMDMNGLRNLSDTVRSEIGEGVILLFSEQAGRVNMVAAVTDEAQKRGAHAGNLLKAIAGAVGGGGGGKVGLAQAGGKNPAGIPAAMEQAAAVLETQICK